ncbi:Mur ligase domain-containing protein [Pedobacter agri]|uniref:Mur ligase domain-containing protein n=1 Tax=Pedobacter agri TaxID=454586 RepID=UPI00030A0E84|nr:Mur ligase domain-containing protein [Pedobacter agri]
MELGKINRVFFVGIGGIGMSALARYFAKRGQVVCGYDKTRTKLTEALEQEGILITYLDESSALPCAFLDHHEDTLIVYTPAIPKDSKILNHFRDKGFSLKKTFRSFRHH